MNKIRSNARQILEKQYRVYHIYSEVSMREYVEVQAENDPNFFCWLFNEDFEEDFDASLSDEQRELYNEFLETL